MATAWLRFGALAALLLALLALPALAANARTWSDSDARASFDLQSTTEDINRKYDLSGKSSALRKTIPRAGMDTVLEIDMDANENPDSKWFSSVGTVRGTYLDGIAILVGFGIIGVLLVLIWSCTFCWCRCCCCNCCCRNCGKTPKPEGYTFTEKLWPGILALVALLVIVVFTSLGLYYNEEFTRGLANKDEGVMQLAINLVGDLDSFAGQTQLKLQTIAVAAPATVASISTYLSRATVLAVGTNGLIDSLQDVSRNMADLEVTVPGEAPVPSLTYTCEFCKTVSTSIANIATEVKEKADPIFENMNSTINSIDETLVEVQNTIAEQVNSSVNAIGDVRSQVQDAQGQMQDVQDDYIQPYDSARRGVGIAILCIPFLWVVLVLLGALCKAKLPFGITYVTAWGIGILMFLLLAIHLPLAALTGDSCGYLDTQEGQIDTRFDDPRAGALINSCLLNTSMVDALNLTEQLNFATLITFPTLPSINESFSFTQLDTFANSVEELSLATFNYSYSPASDLARINAITAVDGDIWTASNVSDMMPEKYIATVSSSDVTVLNVSRANIIVQTTAGIVLNNTLNSIKANVSALVAKKTVLQAQTTSFTNDFYLIQDALQPLLSATQGVVNSMYCGFVGDGYYGIKESYCVTTVTALSGLSLAFFMVAMTAQFLAIASILLCTRLPPTSDDGKRAERLPVATPVDGTGAGTFNPVPGTPGAALTPMEAPTPVGETVQLQPMAFGEQQIEMVSPAATDEGAIFQYSDPGPQSPATNAVQPY